MRELNSREQKIAILKELLDESELSDDFLLGLIHHAVRGVLNTGKQAASFVSRHVTASDFPFLYFQHIILSSS